MRLRNKKTGEIGELNYHDGFLQVVDTSLPLCGNSVKGDYTSLADLNKEWEDGIDDVLDMSDNVVQNNANVKGE